jgi:hypothetical protein
MPHRGADFHWGGALFVEGHPEKAFWFFHCLNLSISWSASHAVLSWRNTVTAINLSAGRSTPDKIFGCHSSRFSFRRPQCVSFREVSNSRWTFRFNALSRPIRAHHGRAVELDDQEQGFYRGLPRHRTNFRPRSIPGYGSLCYIVHRRTEHLQF